MECRDIKLLALMALAITTTWNLPLLAKPNSPARPQNDKQQSDRLKGATLFKKNCQNCHSTGVTSGCLGPVLAGEGARRSRSFIESRISNDPQKIAEFLSSYGHAELMPHMRVAPADAKVLAAYVVSLSAPVNGYDIRGHAAAKKAHAVSLPSASSPETAAHSIDAGKKLVYDRGCLMCHSFGGIGGQFAPSFDGIGSRRSQEYISERISNAELLLGNSGKEYGVRGLVMPPSSLNDADIASISTYLSSLK